MSRFILVAFVLTSTIAAADPNPSPPVRQIRNARLSDGTPIWIELTATDAFVTLDTFRDKRHERTYLSVPLDNRAGNKLMFEAIEHAFAMKAPVGVAWVESPDLGSMGPEWRKPEGHQYWQLQSVFTLTPDSTDAYLVPPRAVTPHGEIKK